MDVFVLGLPILHWRWGDPLVWRCSLALGLSESEEGDGCWMLNYTLWRCHRIQLRINLWVYGALGDCVLRLMLLVPLHNPPQNFKMIGPGVQFYGPKRMCPILYYFQRKEGINRNVVLLNVKASWTHFDIQLYFVSPLLPRPPGSPLPACLVSLT